MKRTSLRLAALAMALFTVLSLAHALAEAGYTPYPTPRTAVSEDSTIYLRDTPAKDTDGAVKLRHMKGKTVSVLGEDPTGKYFYIEYEGKKGFVRAKDFELTDKVPAATPAPGANANNVQYFSTPKTGISRDSAIYMRTSPEIPAKPAKSDSNVARKVKKAKGASFTLLGEAGDWYYAEYDGTKGFVKKADFTIQDANTGSGAGSADSAGKLNRATSGATEVGHGSASEKWGSIKIPGAGTYTIYGNYTNSEGNRYYYSAEYRKGHYEYVHTLTAKGSKVHSVLGHNVRGGKGKYFHNLHHVQNALIGKSRCESCGASCGSKFNTTRITMNLDGYKTWDIMCLYEIAPNQSTEILSYNARPWNTNASSYVSRQLSYAGQSGLKGWINPNVSYSDDGKYAMLITCGDKYENNSNATSKLYVLLKARS